MTTPREWTPPDRLLSARIDRARAQMEAAQEAGDAEVAAAWGAVLAELEAQIPPSDAS